MAAPPSSPLLSTLAALNDDVWISTLVPQLAQDASIEALALTCSSLRDLVQRNFIGTINLQHATASGAAAAAGVAALPERFPNCRGVQLLHAGAGGSEQERAEDAVLSALARLPKLEFVSLDVQGEPAPEALARTLGSMQQQLPQLRHLGVRVRQSWEGDAAAAAWRALGALTQVQHLRMYFLPSSWDAGAGANFNVRHLSALSTLGPTLQELDVAALSVVDQGPPQQQQQQQEALQQEGAAAAPAALAFLGAMQSLRRLHLPLTATAAAGLASVASCTALRSLELGRVAPGPPPVLDAAACAALGCLPQLEVLRLHDGVSCSEPGAFYAALGQLTRLHHVEYHAWEAADALPSLAGLTGLAHLQGAWVHPEEEGAQERFSTPGCAAVVRLTGEGSVPLRAFPSLEALVQTGPLPAPALAALPQHCPRLRELRSMGYLSQPPWPSVAPGAPAAQRVAAVAGLKRLPHLERLALHPADDLEVAALLPACQPWGVRVLQVVPAQRSSVTWLGLMQLAGAAAAGVQELTVGVQDMEWEAAGEQQGGASAPLLLASALRGVPEVAFVCGEARQAAALTRALERAREFGLPLPASCRCVV